MGSVRSPAICRLTSFSCISGSVALAAAVLLGAGCARAAPVAATPQRQQPAKAPEAPSSYPQAEGDAASRDTVARARMLECGHQWNNMKRAGTASGTWKDFSRGCLAQR